MGRDDWMLVVFDDRRERGSLGPRAADLMRYLLRERDYEAARLAAAFWVDDARVVAVPATA